VRPAKAILKGERQIAARLPKLIDKLIALGEAEKPSLGALKYLCDRVMGRPCSVNELPPATACSDKELLERARSVLGHGSLEQSRPASSN
jgi:hypothetical protein